MTHSKSAKSDIRSSILEAARNIAVQEGWPAVTVRHIAEQIDYKAPVIYEYFQNKDDVLQTLADEGYTLLFRALSQAYESGTNPTDRVTAMGQAYWDFAWRHYEIYQLMHGLKGVRPCKPDNPDKDGRRCINVTAKAVQELMGKPDIDHEVMNSVFSLWAMMHGFVSLVSVGHLEHKTAQDAFGAALDNFVKQGENKHV